MRVSVSGIRGVFPTDLRLEHIIEYTSAFSSFSDQGSSILGYDARDSSRMISRVVSSVLRANGKDVYNIGITPTPVLVRECRAEGKGVMITASHNPLVWNGIKFVTEGRCIFRDELDVIESLRSRSKNKGYNRSQLGKEYTKTTSYTKDLLEFIDSKGLKQAISRSRDVIVDTSIGTVTSYIKDILAGLGVDTTILSSNEPDPTSRSLDLLLQPTSSKDSIGFAFDSDADRVVAVRRGSVLLPDDTLLICLHRMLDTQRYSSLTVSVDTSNSVRDMAYAYNLKLHYSKVGEANVVKDMLDNCSMLGGEGSSAGFIAREFNTCRDAILASILILYDEIDAALEYSKYSIKRGNLSIDGIDANRVIEYIVEKEHDHSELIGIDGAKLIIDEYTWALFRASNTEYSIRLSVESRSRGRTDALYKYLMDKIVEACMHVKREGDNKSNKI